MHNRQREIVARVATVATIFYMLAPINAVAAVTDQEIRNAILSRTAPNEAVPYDMDVNGDGKFYIETLQKTGVTPTATFSDVRITLFIG